MSEAEKIQFTPERMETFDRLVGRYEKPQCALLPVLYLAQDQFGYLSPQVMNYVAELLKMPPGHVYDAVSFYTMFRTRKMGRWCLQICHNVTCSMMGAKDLVKAVTSKLGVSVGQMTENELFSVETVECLGSCDKAPVVQINNEFVERSMNEEKLLTLIGDIQEHGEKAVDEVTN